MTGTALEALETTLQGWLSACFAAPSQGYERLVNESPPPSPSDNTASPEAASVSPPATVEAPKISAPSGRRVTGPEEYTNGDGEKALVKALDVLEKYLPEEEDTKNLKYFARAPYGHIPLLNTLASHENRNTHEFFRLRLLPEGMKNALKAAEERMTGLFHTLEGEEAETCREAAGDLEELNNALGLYDKQAAKPRILNEAFPADCGETYFVERTGMPHMERFRQQHPEALAPLFHPRRIIFDYIQDHCDRLPAALRYLGGALGRERWQKFTSPPSPDAGGCPRDIQEAEFAEKARLQAAVLPKAARLAAEKLETDPFRFIYDLHTEIHNPDSWLEPTKENSYLGRRNEPEEHRREFTGFYNIYYDSEDLPVICRQLRNLADAAEALGFDTSEGKEWPQAPETFCRKAAAHAIKPGSSIRGRLNSEQGGLISEQRNLINVSHKTGFSR